MERTRKHPLINIVFMAVCGVLSGANSFAAIHEFAIDRRNWLAGYLDLTHGIPSEDTFARVLARLDPGAFEKCLLSWVQAVQEVTDHRMVAIDGKTVRGSSDHETGQAAIHMVSAWATENKLSLGQVVVDEKSNEITAIPELLQVLEISGALVTIDAMGCQKEIADQIRERGADFVLAVKQNQPTLYEQVEGAIDEALEQDAKDVDEYQTVEKGHGRRETRTYAIFPAPESVDPEDLWRDLRRGGDRDLGTGGLERTTRHGDSLLHPQPAGDGPGVRNSSPQSLGHREQSPLAVGREFPRGRMPSVPRSRAGQPECDSAVRPGPAETRHQLPKGNRDQTQQVCGK